jgi:hypothetical protein
LPGQRKLTKDEQDKAQAELKAQQEKAEKEKLAAAEAYRLALIEAGKANKAAADGKKADEKKDDPSPEDKEKQGKLMEKARAAGEELKRAADDFAKKRDELDGINHFLSHPEDLYTVFSSSRTAPGTLSTCEQVASFLDQCNSQNWRGPDCETFLNRVKKCADPSLIRTDGGEGVCGFPPVKPEDAEHALVVACDPGRKLPVPGQDPCQKVIDGPKVTEYFGRNGFRRPAPGCGDPNSRVEPEACTGTFRIIDFGVPDLQQLADWGKKHLGGPLILITVKNPEPNPRPEPTPNPQPRPK